VFVPITLDWFNRPRLADRFLYWTYVFGRLKPGVTIEEAQAAINVPYHAALNDIEAPVVRGLEGKDLERFRTKSIELRPGASGQSEAPRVARTPLAMFFGAAAMIFLIACVNLANLMFARGATRIGEIAVRSSMGAAPHRLFGLLATEAFLLATCAAIVSLPIALAVLRAVGALLPPYTVSALDPTLSLRAIAVAFAVAALSTIVFALVPMLKLAASDPASTLQANGAARVFGGRGLGRFRFVLSTAQISLSMLLLALAGLFTHSLANIARVDLGLRTDSLVTFTVEPSGNGYSAERSRQLFDRIEQELAAQPGVTDVTSSTISLLDGEAWGRGVSVEGRPPEGMPGDHAYVNYVGTHFLSTFGIPLLAGREFTEADSEGRPLVAMVNEAFAERFGLGRNPIGKRVTTRGGAPNIEIVGLFGDTAYNMVKQPSVPQVVTPRRQELDTSQMSFYARTAQSPDALLAAIPRIVANVDPDLPATNVRTFASQIRKNVRADWLLTTLAGSLAAIATLLAALGLYGVLSCTVGQRTREIGVRLALGAAPERVRAMVLKQVARMVAIGVPLGLLGALLIGRVAAAMLYGLAPTDPVAFVAACVLLTAVVLGASYMPARRASRVDPVVALRAE
jgi:predicted permease